MLVRVAGLGPEGLRWPLPQRQLDHRVARYPGLVVGCPSRGDDAVMMLHAGRTGAGGWARGGVPGADRVVSRTCTKPAMASGCSTSPHRASRWCRGPGLCAGGRRSGDLPMATACRWHCAHRGRSSSSWAGGAGGRPALAGTAGRRFHRAQAASTAGAGWMRPQRRVGEGVVTALVEAGFGHLPLRRVCGADTTRHWRGSNVRASKRQCGDWRRPRPGAGTLMHVWIGGNVVAPAGVGRGAGAGPGHGPGAAPPRPDDGGSWVDAEAGIALAHRRLSILDLSPLGHQPMASADGRYVMAYNGEVYNFAALREELEPLGHAFRGHSDTEVLLAAILQWGVEDTLQRCNGMFAIALWDRQERCCGWPAIASARSRCTWLGRRHAGVRFGTEGALAAPGVRQRHRPRCAHLAAAAGLHPGAAQHPPALLQADAGPGVAPGRGGVAARIRASSGTGTAAVWDARARMQAALAAPFQGRIEDAEEQLDTLLRDAVALRMVADVPVGVFLSGGTDSSLVASLMQAQSGQPVHSFSIGFTDSGHDEAPLAGSWRPTWAVITPSCTSAAPTRWRWCRSCRRCSMSLCRRIAGADRAGRPAGAAGVTVALSGDGGDELFFGYTRYVRALRNWRMLAACRAAAALDGRACAAGRSLAHRRPGRATGRDRCAWHRRPHRISRWRDRPRR